ncbi:hypothetical protein GCM10023334_042680 [Nonomuraea thailandensis]
MPKVSVAAIRYRTRSATIGPASGAIRAIGSDLNRSKTPFSMSSRSCVPVAMHVVSTVWARMPGTIRGR